MVNFSLANRKTREVPLETSRINAKDRASSLIKEIDNLITRKSKAGDGEGKKGLEQLRNDVRGIRDKFHFAKSSKELRNIEKELDASQSLVGKAGLGKYNCTYFTHQTPKTDVNFGGNGAKKTGNSQKKSKPVVPLDAYSKKSESHEIPRLPVEEKQIYRQPRP
ncbi:Uncharacterised protein [uncultured archaeon]|nr:Uncharacterised protein [uncultured archaeon]